MITHDDFIRIGREEGLREEYLEAVWSRWSRRPREFQDVLDVLDRGEETIRLAIRILSKILDIRRTMQ